MCFVRQMIQGNGPYIISVAAAALLKLPAAIRDDYLGGQDVNLPKVAALPSPTLTLTLPCATPPSALIAISLSIHNTAATHYCQGCTG